MQVLRWRYLLVGGLTTASLCALFTLLSDVQRMDHNGDGASESDCELLHGSTPGCVLAEQSHAKRD